MMHKLINCTSEKPFENFQHFNQPDTKAHQKKDTEDRKNVNGLHKIESDTIASEGSMMTAKSLSGCSWVTPWPDGHRRPGVVKRNFSDTYDTSACFGFIYISWKCIRDTRRFELQIRFCVQVDSRVSGRLKLCLYGKFRFKNSTFYIIHFEVIFRWRI